MSYLVLMNQERRMDVVDGDDDVIRMCLTYIEPDIVEDWLAKAQPFDNLRDFRFGRVNVIKLGDMTDAQGIVARREAAKEIEEATRAMSRARRLVEGKETP